MRIMRDCVQPAHIYAWPIHQHRDTPQDRDRQCAYFRQSSMPAARQKNWPKRVVRLGCDQKSKANSGANFHIPSEQKPHSDGQRQKYRIVLPHQNRVERRRAQQKPEKLAMLKTVSILLDQQGGARQEQHHGKNGPDFYSNVRTYRGPSRQEREKRWRAKVQVNDGRVVCQRMESQRIRGIGIQMVSRGPAGSPECPKNFEIPLRRGVRAAQVQHGGNDQKESSQAPGTPQQQTAAI